jgi:hypothetical protein
MDRATAVSLLALAEELSPALTSPDARDSLDRLDGRSDEMAPDGPRDKAYVLAAIEHLEGAMRPARRRRRLPERQLPLTFKRPSKRGCTRRTRLP